MRDEKSVQNFVGKPEGKGKLERDSINGRILRKWNLK
jgi:hypothetical protein